MNFQVYSCVRLKSVLFLGDVLTVAMYSLSDSRSVSVANDAVDPSIITVPGMVVVHFFRVIAADVTTAGSRSSLKLTATTGSTKVLPERSAGITELIPAFNGSPIDGS